MLTALKYYLKLALIPALFISGFGVMLVTMFKEARWGLFLLVFLIPQPNIWHKFYNFPMGKDFIDLLFFAILFGILFQKKGFVGTDNSWFIIAFIIVSYLALWNSSMRFSLPLPISLSNGFLYEWKNYIQMILMYFFVLNIIKDEDQQKNLIMLMSLVVLLASIRSYRSFSGGEAFSYVKRYEGPFWYVGLNANHFAAFIAYCWAAFLGFFFFDINKKRKWIFLSTVVFALHPLFFAYSRGAYLATLGAITFYGIIKKRSLLIVVAVIILVWQIILPKSVVDRIMMTKTESGELESSASHRLILWNHAMGLLEQNPIFGAGFGAFGFTVPEEEILSDTHNFYVKILCEQGLIGFILFLMLFYKAFRSGWQLFKIGKTHFHQGLGFGFMGTVIASMITNMFGDRWSYFVLGSYFWIFWGLVDRGILLYQTNVQQT